MKMDFDPRSEVYNDLDEDVKIQLHRFSKTNLEQDFDRLVKAILKDLGVDTDGVEISDDTYFIEDLGLDSLALAEMVFFFEDVFGVLITNEDLSYLKTLGDFKQFLRQNLNWGNDG